MKTPIPRANSISAAFRHCSSSRADKSQSRWWARSRAMRSRKPFSATSCNRSMTDRNRAGASQASRRRCPWAKSEVMIRYHDEEWGVPVHDDRTLFEFLILEGAQAGLSWETILNKRESYRAAFDHFDPASVAKYGQKKRKSLLSDAGIVR